MNSPDKLTVFSFRVYDMSTRTWRLSGYKATREVIAHMGGEVLEGTAEEVPPVVLDERGRYRRVATGWGELP